MRPPQGQLRTGLTYWQSRPVPCLPVAPLRADQKTEVLVISAGMTGAMAAEALAAFAWCGSFGASPTGLPTIGAIPERPGCLAILAFGGNGITYSRIAAEVITAQLTGQPDVDADLFAFP